MGKKKWSAHGDRRKNNKNTHKKGKGSHAGNPKQFKYGGKNRNQKGPNPNGEEVKETNPNEVFHTRMAKFNLMEKDVGVTEYIGKTPGFNAVIKSRFSDFQVNEIDLNGEIVKLTDTSIPQPPQPAIDINSETKQQVVELIGQDVWDSLVELSKATGKPSDVEVDAESLTKVQRGIVHNFVKESFGSSIVSSTMTKDEKKFFKFSKFKKNVGNDQRTKWLWPGEYTYFVVYKENLDTMKAAGDLSQGLNSNSKAISYAGTKDKRAKTTQWFCIRKREPEKISKAADMKKAIHVGNFMFKDEPLKLGCLSGNRFRIALRHIVHDESDIELSLQSLKENGFINYYGLQRFGNNSAVPTHQVGLALIKGQFKEACELILKPREGEQTFMKEIREHWWRNRDPAAALKFFYKSGHNGVEAKLLTGLSRHGKNDFVNSLNNVPRNMLLMYLHAYQSLIWNEIASKRIKLGLQLQPGDLVFVNNDKSSDVIPELKEVIDDDGVLFAEDDGDDEDKSNEEVTSQEEVSVFKNMVKPLAADDISSGKYSIFDVVLPLPGHDISYPTNESGQWYIDRLAQDDLSSEKLKSKQKMYSLCGAYRKLLVKPKNLSWYFMKYKNESDDLIQSDLEELRKQEAPKSAEDGEFKALILDFCLPTATYATMLLREVFKDDTSASNQMKLGVESIASGLKKKRKVEETGNEEETSAKKLKTNDDDVADDIAIEVADDTAIEVADDIANEVADDKADIAEGIADEGTLAE